MSRIRTVKPEFFSHPKVLACSIPARLLLISIWTEADDEGRLYDQPDRLAALAFGSSKDFDGDELLDLLAREGLIERYSARNLALIQVHDWRDHQKIDRPRPSVLPAPPKHRRREASTNVRRELEESSTLERKGTERKGKEQNNNKTNTLATAQNGGRGGGADPLRVSVKNAIATEWTGGVGGLSPSMWGRIEQAASEVLAAGVGPFAEQGLAPSDIPEGLGIVHGLWAKVHPGIEFPPQTQAREWVRFLNGALAQDAEVADDRAAWIERVRRRMR